VVHRIVSKYLHASRVSISVQWNIVEARFDMSYCAWMLLRILLQRPWWIDNCSAYRLLHCFHYLPLVAILLSKSFPFHSCYKCTLVTVSRNEDGCMILKKWNLLCRLSQPLMTLGKKNSTRLLSFHYGSIICFWVLKRICMGYKTSTSLRGNTTKHPLWLPFLNKLQATVSFWLTYWQTLPREYSCTGSWYWVAKALREEGIRSWLGNQNCTASTKSRLKIGSLCARSLSNSWAFSELYHYQWLLSPGQARCRCPQLRCSPVGGQP